MGSWFIGMEAFLGLCIIAVPIWWVGGTLRITLLELRDAIRDVRHELGELVRIADGRRR